MTIGEKIKYLRQRNDITQEKLAEYLNISYQAISKWENNNAFPDISLVVPLANFFGVSIDELFDRDAALQEAELETYERTSQALTEQGASACAERIALWREAVRKYPRNFRCLISLAYALQYTLNYKDVYKDSCEQNAQEVVAICERILNDCTDQGIRESAIQLLVFTFADPALSIANEEKAVTYAKMAGSYYSCRETLLAHAYFTGESREKALHSRHQNTLAYMDFLCMNLATEKGLSPEEAIFACETAQKLWSALIHDGNFLFYHSRMAWLSYQLAKNYAILQKREETLFHLQQSAFHARAFDELPFGEQTYTSVFVRFATSNKDFPTDKLDTLRSSLQNACFDFVRDDPAFTALLAEEA